MKRFHWFTRMVSLVLAVVLTVCGSTIASGSMGTGEDLQSDKLFYTAHFSPEMNQFLQGSYSTIAPVIATDLLNQGVFISQISVGTPVSIDINDNFFYVPLLHNGAVVYIICIGETGDPNSPYSLAYGKLFADELNNLPNDEIYRIVNDDGDVYAVSQNVSEFLMQGPGDECEDEVSSLEPEAAIATFAFVEEESLEVVSLEAVIDTITMPRQSRTVSAATLQVPHVSNVGSNCWLASALSIVNYRKNTSYSVATTHSLFHPQHTISECTGASLAVSDVVLRNYITYAGGGTTIVYTPVTPETVRTQINAASPLLIRCGLYDSARTRTSGHQIVICGYSYDNSNGKFITYTFADPNHFSKVNVTYYSGDGSYNITYYYNISGNSYEWDGTIYNI